MRTILKRVFKFGVLCSVLISLWITAALVLPHVKTSPQEVSVSKPVTIYVRSNGVHTDLVLPRTGAVYNWDLFLHESLFPMVDASYPFIAIGWGDKGFYLDTPTWADLKASTACRAAFGLGSTAMHVTYYKTIKSGPMVKEIHLSEERYQKLIAYILQSFSTDQQEIRLISHPEYGVHDNYFEARGRYSLFKTCNVWTGNALKEAGVTIGVWTPLASGIIDHL